jgi:hypothetical protein
MHHVVIVHSSIIFICFFRRTFLHHYLIHGIQEIFQRDSVQI